MFYSKTVASITASLARIVDELKAHHASKTAEAAKHSDAAAVLTLKATEAQQEAAKATAAADKIASLLA